MKEVDEIQPLIENDQQAFDELYQKYHERVYSICLRMTQNAFESEDLTQDVFIRLFQTIGSFRGESAFTTWLYRLTVNLVLMHFRKRKRRGDKNNGNGELAAYNVPGRPNPKRKKKV